MLQELAEKQPVKDYLPDMCHIQKERGLFAKEIYKSEENNKKMERKRCLWGRNRSQVTN